MLNDFYSANCLGNTGCEAVYEVEFAADHSIFSGHFPRQPVVPGVCTTAITKALLEEALGLKLLITEARQIKFLQLLTPDLRPTATIKWVLREPGIYGLDSVWTLDGKAVYKLNAILSEQK